MRSRPFAFYFLSILCLMYSLSLLISPAYVYHYSWWQLFKAFSYFSLLNWITFIMLTAHIFLYPKVFGFLRFTSIALILLVALNNLLVFIVTPDHFTNRYSPLLSAAIFALLTVLGLMQKSCWSLINRPTLHWWSTSRRVKRNLPISVVASNNKVFKAKTYDISMSGAFLCSLDENWNLAAGNIVTLRIPAMELECKAEIIRFTFGKGNYPEGAGVRFRELSEKSKHLISYFIDGRPENLLAKPSN